MLKLRQDPKKAAKTRKYVPTASNQGMTQAQVDLFEFNLLNIMREVDLESGHGYGNMYQEFLTNTVNAYNVYTQALAVAAAGPWAGRPPKPLTMAQNDYDDIMNVIDADDAANFGAAFAVRANFEIDMGDVTENSYCDPEPDEFSDFRWQILEAFAHSGFSGVGDYHQVLTFNYLDYPDDTHYDYTVDLSRVITVLPPNCTPRNLGVFYAETIAKTAKQKNIFFDWGIRHNVPAELNHLGFATWMFIKDPTILNEDMRQTMARVTRVALRDRSTFSFSDPLDAVGVGVDDIELTARLAQLDIEAAREARDRIREARTPFRSPRTTPGQTRRGNDD
jgi:hypothetical protein